MNHYYKAAEIKEMLGLQDIWAAEQVIEELNKEIKAQDLWIVNDRVHAIHFHEKYPGNIVRIPEKNKMFISKETQQEIFEFFMRTSAMRLAKEAKDKQES